MLVSCGLRGCEREVGVSEAVWVERLMVQVRRMGDEEDEKRVISSSASSPSPWSSSGMKEEEETKGSMARFVMALVWPLSLWRILLVEISQMMMVESAEPEMRMGVLLMVVARTVLRKSVWPASFRMLVGLSSGMA